MKNQSVMDGQMERRMDNLKTVNPHPQKPQFAGGIIKILTYHPIFIHMFIQLTDLFFFGPQTSTLFLHGESKASDYFYNSLFFN